LSYAPGRTPKEGQRMNYSIADAAYGAVHGANKKQQSSR